MTPTQLRELIRQLHEFLLWLENQEPATLSCYAVRDCVVVAQVELLALVKDGAQ